MKKLVYLFLFLSINYSAQESDFIDDFKTDSGKWKSYAHPHKISFSKGHLIINQHHGPFGPTNGAIINSQLLNHSKDFTIKTQIKTDFGDNKYGLIWNFKDDKNYYNFNVYHGLKFLSFSVFQVKNGVLFNIISNKPTEIKRDRFKAYTELSIVKKGDYCSFFIGEKEVYKTKIPVIQTFLKSGIYFKEKSIQKTNRIRVDYFSFNNQNNFENTLVDSTAPKIIIYSPEKQDETYNKNEVYLVNNSKQGTLKFSAEDNNGIYKVTIDGKEVKLGPDNAYSKVYNFLYSGYHRTTIKAVDNEANINTKTIYLKNVGNYKIETVQNRTNKVTDNSAPIISITSPNVNRGFSIVKNAKSTTIKGHVSDDSKIYEVLINGQEAYVDANGNFTKNVILGVGNNSFTVKATDVKMNSSTKTFTIRRDIQNNQNSVTNNTKSNVISTGKYYALIIGNNTYKDEAIASLDEPIKDATKLYNVLTTKYAFKKENVTLLKNATYVETITAFDKLGNTLTANDNLLVFYAGHGWWDETKDLGYWLPTDARKSNTAFWIRNSTISDYMASIKTKHTLLIADACFSGSIFKTRSAFDNAPLAVKKLNDLPSKKAMTSGNLKEVPDKSVFLKYLVQRLNENTEKYLPADKLFSSFRRAVLSNSPNAPQFGTIQNAGDEGGEFIFVKKN